MDAHSSLTVRVDRIGNKYIWQLYREGIFEKVKYSGPFYKSEEFAMAAGLAARPLHCPAGASKAAVNTLARWPANDAR
jgi:hypothetical protein